ncbi:MAG: hypothetical protein ACLFQJ_06565 [Campylobacterales bacterium]
MSGESQKGLVLLKKILLFLLVVIFAIMLLLNFVPRTNHVDGLMMLSLLVITYMIFVFKKQSIIKGGYYELFFKAFLKYPFASILVPTFALAKYKKHEIDNSEFSTSQKKNQRKKLLIDLNLLNFYSSVAIFILAILISCIYDYFELNELIGNVEHLKYPFVILLSIFILLFVSRGIEIFVAFYKDAIRHFNEARARSSLSRADRVELAIRSYIELIINYGMIYYLINLISLIMSGEYILNDITNPIQALYSSMASILTVEFISVNSDFRYSVLADIITLLSPIEVLNGLILIVVSFTVYTSIEDVEKNEDRE